MINILLADDHPIVRAGVRELLRAEHDMLIAAEAATGDEALAAIAVHAVDVVIMDISMPGPPFLELLRRLREAAPSARVLVMSMHPERQYAVRALRGGASGYLAKDRTVDELPAAIRLLHSGRRYVTASLAEQLADALNDQQSDPHEQLSAREFDVFRMLVAGKTVKHIAAALSLSVKTVSTYRTRVLQKLGAQSTADLVRYAVQHQLLDGDGR